MAVKPVNPPAFDVAKFDEPLRQGFPLPNGEPRTVYSGQHGEWKRWVNGDGPYDGKGLADAVKTNATDLNGTKSKVTNLENEVADLAGRLAVLEAQPTVRPFP